MTRAKKYFLIALVAMIAITAGTGCFHRRGLCRDDDDCRNYR